MMGHVLVWVTNIAMSAIKLFLVRITIRRANFATGKVISNDVIARTPDGVRFETLEASSPTEPGRPNGLSG